MTKAPNASLSTSSAEFRPIRFPIRLSSTLCSVYLYHFIHALIQPMLRRQPEKSRSSLRPQKWSLVSSHRSIATRTRILLLVSWSLIERIILMCALYVCSVIGLSSLSTCGTVSRNPRRSWHTSSHKIRCSRRVDANFSYCTASASCWLRSSRLSASSCIFCDTRTLSSSTSGSFSFTSFPSSSTSGIGSSPRARRMASIISASAFSATSFCSRSASSASMRFIVRLTRSICSLMLLMLSIAFFLSPRKMLVLLSTENR
mmetsp:Transcript_30987/g.75604  ORF Transcript_30987/g.75604 Transcript_30987/m.75604 type:complete len:259 (-) Transcript_30987:571-1347(-)